MKIFTFFCFSGEESIEKISGILKDHRGAGRLKRTDIFQLVASIFFLIFSWLNLYQ